MKKSLLIILFTWVLTSAWGQGHNSKGFYAPNGKYIAVLASKQDGKNSVEGSNILIISGDIKLKGKIKQLEPLSPFCFFEYDVTFKDSVHIKVTHPNFKTHEETVSAKDLSDKHMVILKKKDVK